MMDDDEEVPEWIKQADKEAKEAAMARRYPKKAITDDWRFWLACIGGVGFVSAAFNMYQQTGGFGGSTAVRPELII